MDEEGLNVVQERYAADHIPALYEPLAGDNGLGQTEALIEVHDEEEGRPGRVDEQEDGVLGEYGREVVLALAHEALVVRIVVVRVGEMECGAVVVLNGSRIEVALHVQALLDASVGEQGEQVEREHAHERHEVAHGDVHHVGAEVDDLLRTARFTTAVVVVVVVVVIVDAVR